jgi:mannose-1-phosphate guanylyltransferase/CheY-like chemotaxis protein
MTRIRAVLGRHGPGAAGIIVAVTVIMHSSRWPGGAAFDTSDTKTAPRVLVVEDDSEMATLLRDVLEHSGFHVSLATSGPDAIALMDRTRFATAIVDKELPHVSGLDLISFMTHRAPGMPVMLMTAFGGALVAQAALERGAIRYLEKPVKVAELIEAVRAATRSDEVARPVGLPADAAVRGSRLPPAPGGRATLWAIVLAGGQGRRLLPLTRVLYGEPRPKQYAALAGSRSMLSQTLDRVGRTIPYERTVVATLRSHAPYLKRERIPEAATVLPQPSDRGTGPGVLFPVHWIRHRDPDATVVVFPSDHVVDPEATFMERVAEVAAFVDRHPERIVLLGARATEPEPEYGWIEAGEIVGWTRGGPVRAVRRFVEKPPSTTARLCYDRGDFWNTLVCVARATVLVDVGRQFLSRVHAALSRLDFAGGPSVATLRHAYAGMPAASFSTAVLENCTPVLAVSELTGVTWSDLGSPRRAARSLKRGGVEAPWSKRFGLEA